MSVLVTGATGFVGTWLTNKLLDLGLEVRALLRSPSHAPKELHLQKLKVYLGDVTDYESVLKATEQVDTVFHLAGVVGYSRRERPLMDKVNIQGTDNVIKACAQNKVRRLVHMSSVVAVGASFDKTPLNEDSPYNVQHLNLGYFETKHQAELLVKEATQKGFIDSVVLNPSTIYGAGDARKGSRKTQLKVAQGRLPFYTTGGVSIVAVEDVVDATITAWQRGRSGERYILSGENITIRQLFQIIADCAGVPAPKICLPKPVVFALGFIGDGLERFNKKGPLNSENAWTSTLYHWFDSSKAQRELGLKVPPARVPIEKSVLWMKQNGLLDL